jgi:hypothetical protein
MNRFFSLAATSAVFLAAHAASGATTNVYDSGGFESTSRFTPGNLVGQDGGLWSSLAGASGGNVPATVQTGTKLGNQAVQLTRNSGSYFYFPATPFQGPPAGQPYLYVGFSLNVSAPTNAGQSYGPVFGTEIYDSIGGRLGGAGIDATSKTFVYETPGTYVDGPTVSLNTWYSILEIYNFNTKTYEVLLNGAPIASNLPWLNMYANQQFGDADFFGSPGQPETGPGPFATANGFFDNFTVTWNSVPEPSSLALFGTAGMLLTRRKSGRRSPDTV